MAKASKESPGKRRALPTSKDVAALAGVSQSTVSYVLTGKRTISVETRRRVEKAVKELSYEPNAGARALRGSRTNVIALMVHLGTDADLNESVPYIDTIIEEARSRDFEVLLSTADEGAKGLKRLAGRRVADAFVLMDVKTNDERLEAAEKLDQPTVLFGRPYDSRGLDAVDFDSRRAAELLVDHLVDAGHRHIAMVGETSDIRDADFRFIRDFHEGARDRASRHDVDFSIIERPRDGWSGMESIGDELFRHENDALGIISRTPQVTEWLVQLARVRGRTIGSDISLVALSTDVNATAFDPPISNVSPRPRDLSRLAMRVLFDRLEGDPSPAQLRLIEPREITARSSVAKF